MFDTVFGALGDIGLFVFAVSGGIVAIRRNMDVLGVLFLAFLPAIGGGTLRDVMLDVPIFWLESDRSLWISLAGGVAAFALYPLWTKIRLLVWADAIGLSVFVAIGAAKAMEFGHGILVTIMMGVITAIAGGILRDVVAGEENLLLREEIYATAAIIGSIVVWVCLTYGVDLNVTLIAAALTTFAIRAAGIVFKLKLPKRRLP